MHDPLLTNRESEMILQDHSKNYSSAVRLLECKLAWLAFEPCCGCKNSFLETNPTGRHTHNPPEIGNTYRDSHFDKTTIFNRTSSL